MQRLIFMIGVLALIAVCANIIVAYRDNPMEYRKDLLKERLSEIEPEVIDLAIKATKNYDIIQESINSKPALWKRLYSPPKAKPKVYDLAKACAGVKIKKQKVGSRVKIVYPGNAKGKLLGVGDVIHDDIKIKEIAKDKVVFSRMDLGVELTHSVPR